MLSVKKNKGKRTAVIAITAAMTIGLGIGARPASAFTLQDLLGAFGLGDLFTGVTGLFASGSELFKNISSLTADLNVTPGALGIQDTTEIYAQAVADYKNNDNDNPIDAGLMAERIRSAVAGQIGSAPITKLGQTKAIESMQQQVNLTKAANDAATATENSTSSLEALQKGIQTTNAMSQQLQNMSIQQLQNNQTAAAGVQVQQQVGRELAKANDRASIERDRDINTLRMSGTFVQPLFVKH